MTDLPEVKLKSLVNFPASAVGRTAMTVTKTAGTFFLDLNYKDIQITPTVAAPDLPNAYNLIWDEVKQTFAKVPFALQATAGVASLGGQIGALGIDGTLKFTGATLSVVGGSQIYDTRTSAIAASIPAVVTSIIVRRYTSSDVISDAPYKRGAGQQSFADALGATWSLDLSGTIVKSRWFQIKGDGATDDTAALQLAVTAATGKTLWIEGFCGVSARIVLLDDTTIIGGNNRFDGFRVLGSSSLGSGILYANNKSNIKIRNLRFTGNLVEPAPFSTGAIRFEMDSAAVTDMVSFEVSGCFFENFRTTEWIWFVSAAQVGNTGNMREIKVFNNEVYAIPGCAVTNAISGNNGNTFVRVTGNGATVIPAIPAGGAFTGAVANILFTNNSCVGLGLSGMFQAFANTRDMVISGTVTRNMGNNTIPADFSYTYLFYNSDPTRVDPTNIVVSGNTGYGNHNNAAYAAGARNIAITGNSFGFTYPSGIEPTLPHGSAIALNSVVDATVSGNVLTDALVGVAYVGISFRASTVTIANNTIRSSASSSAGQIACGILLSGDAGGVASITNVVGNSVTMTNAAASAGISIVGGFNYGRLNIADNVISATQFGINCTATLLASTVLRLSGNHYAGTMVLFGMNLDTSGLTILADEVVDCSLQTAGGAVGARLNPGTYIIDGLTIANGSVSNTAFAASGAVQGTLRNVTFPGWAGTQVLAGSLGLAKPTWTAKIGATVENLGKAELGSATSKYIVDHWVNVSGSTTWQDQRMLTGN